MCRTELDPEEQFGDHGQTRTDDGASNSGIPDPHIHTPAVVDEIPHRIRVEEVSDHWNNPSMSLCILAIVYSFT
jgi:hypothetical protein